ncbi:SUMF1/EgtB/PvdO family nonheme iron enzyme [Thiothrix lacustris]|uniref:SUMF1/EgtB/PvdO family nonheme iron enzyme n=1 Tax=Thiothrix lacustris TaxID=525917 RepID=UPI0027E3E45B|nr:SUMF1/EgtB/PvdO family nonheme iron enzyme [Thiothrix lacustris]WMP16967.1 SUMF1/EgtB/PvdO family nonheme iron enzyme [Thiothrix lacustris]
MQQIFISYAQDQAHGQRLAEQVQQQLHGAGFAVFRDVSGVIPGTKWVHEIERQLKASELVVLVVSAKALHSDWVFAEFDMAKEHQIPIIPVFAEALSAPLWLRHLQRLDFSREADWQRLMQAISSHITVPSPQAPYSPPVPVLVKQQPDLAWANASGDDQYGRYADVDVKGVIQRFRWLQPGKFLMGSPQSEKERSDDEVQHEVTLSQGFWLADTACTQALWQAVMGNNPADFSDDLRNPVEQVSWDHTQGFIQQLNGVVSGLKAKLPTEAQWEYACRAGSTSPFSFGTNITPEQVNYDGNYPYAGGKKGLYREKTVPVKSLPANPWGLYEMHGNVWEWCQDWYGSYPAEPVRNPEGSQTGVRRVVRGGSWDDFGGYVRSAIRFRYDPANRRDFIGFRLALGH